VSSCVGSGRILHRSRRYSPAERAPSSSRLVRSCSCPATAIGHAHSLPVKPRDRWSGQRARYTATLRTSRWRCGVRDAWQVLTDVRVLRPSGSPRTIVPSLLGLRVSRRGISWRWSGSTTTGRRKRSPIASTRRTARRRAPRPWTRWSSSPACACTYPDKGHVTTRRYGWYANRS